MNYLEHWMHAYLMHFGIWVTFMIGVTVYKEGVPPLDRIKSMLISSVVLASIVAAFSSHSQTHFVTQILNKANIAEESK